MLLLLLLSVLLGYCRHVWVVSGAISKIYSNDFFSLRIRSILCTVNDGNNLCVEKKTFLWLYDALSLILIGHYFNSSNFMVNNVRSLIVRFLFVIVITKKKWWSSKKRCHITINQILFFVMINKNLFYYTFHRHSQYYWWKKI